MLTDEAYADFQTDIEEPEEPNPYALEANKKELEEPVKKKMDYGEIPAETEKRKKKIAQMMIEGHEIALLDDLTEEALTDADREELEAVVAHLRVGNFTTKFMELAGEPGFLELVAGVTLSGDSVSISELEANLPAGAKIVEQSDTGQTAPLVLVFELY